MEKHASIREEQKSKSHTSVEVEDDEGEEDSFELQIGYDCS